MEAKLGKRPASREGVGDSGRVCQTALSSSSFGKIVFRCYEPGRVAAGSGLGRAAWAAERGSSSRACWGPGPSRRGAPWWASRHFKGVKGPQQQEAFPVVSLRPEGPKSEQQSRTFTSRFKADVFEMVWNCPPTRVDRLSLLAFSNNGINDNAWGRTPRLFCVFYKHVSGLT